jgi:solute carrier family 29 (equilibrative nucleoside transporter), member 1/2/3
MVAISVLTVLTLMLTLSTYFHPSPDVFFAFVMFNGIAQAAAGSYLQTSVIAVASLFGPTALQSMMSGQAAIAVAVSGVEVVSAAVSLHNPPSPGVTADTRPEEKSAFIFFALSTMFYVLSAAAHIQLTRLPAYRDLMEQFSQATHSSPSVSHHVSEIVHEKKRHQLFRVAKTNAIYNFAVAYVFIITLVSAPHCITRSY